MPGNSISRFFSGAAQSIRFARRANEIANTPDSVFRARGTTKDQALRDLISDR